MENQSEILAQLEDDLQDFNSSEKDQKSLSEAVRKLVSYEQAIELKENELKSLKSGRDKVSEEIIPGIMDELGLSKLKLDNGLTLSVVNDIRAHISEANKQQAYQWLRENGRGSIIKNQVAVQFDKTQDAEAIALKEKLNAEGLPVLHTETIHAGTLKSTCREAVEKGIAIPEDLFGLYIGKKTKVSKS